MPVEAKRIRPYEHRLSDGKDMSRKSIKTFNVDLCAVISTEESYICVVLSALLLMMNNQHARG